MIANVHNLNTLMNIANQSDFQGFYLDLDAHSEYCQFTINSNGITNCCTPS